MPEPPALLLDRATLQLDGRTLWEDMSLTISCGECLAIMGPNGAGKTTLLRVALGLQRLSRGSVRVHGAPPRRGTAAIGYVPQQRAFDLELPVRGRDLVAFGLDGHRWGIPVPSRTARRRVDEMLQALGADRYADMPIGRLSGGEQQRLRIAQALVGSPGMLLCDEPLLSLDLHSQQAIVQLISRWNRHRGATVVFVTHDINPVLAVANRILLLAGGRWAVGQPEEMLTAATLTRLYGVPVEVLRVGGRVVIVGAELGGHEPVPAHPAVTP